MGWTTVETPNAKYMLIFSPHFRPIEMPPKNIDAFILESASGQEAGELAKGLIKYENYKKPIESAIRGGKDIWVTDPATTLYSDQVVFGKVTAWAVAGAVVSSLSKIPKNRKISRREFFARMLGKAAPVIFFSPLAALLSLGHSKSRIKHELFWQGTHKSVEFLYGSKGIGTLRNAVTAEKAESFVAPMLRQRLGKKPVIAMVWGPMHFGIKKLLQNPAKRKRILSENDLDRYLVKYSRAIQIKLDPQGRISEVKEFKEALLPKPAKIEIRPERTFTRRDLLKKALRRI
jgi:hypothetical protein